MVTILLDLQVAAVNMWLFQPQQTLPSCSSLHCEHLAVSRPPHPILLAAP